MSTLTTRLGLTKPDGSENVDITTINDAFDIIDAAAGATVCTSGSRPSSPFTGRTIYETDTGKLLVNSGASASPSWQDPVANGLAGTISVGGDINVTGTVRPTVATVATLAFGSSVSGDGFRRVGITGAGEISWGDGTGSRDTNLYRASANTLKTDDDFEAAGISAGSDSSVTGNLNVSGTVTVGGLELPATSWTPSWSAVTLGTSNINEGYYVDLGEWVAFAFRTQFGTSPSFSSTIQLTLPVAAWVGGVTSSQIQEFVGGWTFRDDSGPYHYSGSLGIWSTAGTSVSFNGAWDGTAPRSRITNAVPFTVAVGDILSGGGIYKKA